MKLTQVLGGTVIGGAMMLVGTIGAHAHTNSVGFDLVDQGDGSCDLEWYYGSWHSQDGIGPEGSFSLYTLAEGGDPGNPADYTVEAYGTGGAIRDETNYFTWPGKNTANITLNTAIETDFSGSVGSYYEEDGVGGVDNDIENTGFVPGKNYFFTTSGGAELTDASGANNQTYSHQSVTVRNVQRGTFRGFYEENGWDQTPPPAGTPAITANFQPATAIQNGLVTVASACRVFVGAVPKILIESVDDDNGLSSNDFVASVRNVVIRGTVDSSNVDESTMQVSVGEDTYALADNELTLDGDNWVLTLPETIAPKGYQVTASVNDEQPETFTDEITLQIIAVSVEEITEDDGISETDFRTSDSTLLIHGIFSASSAGSLSVTVNGQRYTLDGGAPGDELLTNSGDDWTLDLSGTTLSPGSYTVDAVVTEGGEEFLESQAIEVVSAPAPPTVDSISEDTGIEGDFQTTDDTLEITGTYDVDNTDSFVIEFVGETYRPEDPELTVDGSSWILDVTARTLGTGSFTLTATSTDSAGWPSRAAQEIRIVVDEDGDGMPDDEDAFPKAVTRVSRPEDSPVVLETTPRTGDSACSIDSGSFDPDAPHPAPEVYIPLGRAISFELSGCSNGETIDVSVDFGEDLPAGARVHKVTDEGWSEPIAATISGSVVTYSVTDGGELDEDGEANGTIVDPVSISMPASPVPVSPLWMLGGLTLLLGLLGGTSRGIRGRSVSRARFTD